MTVTQLFVASAAAGTLAALAAQWRREPSASAESIRRGTPDVRAAAAIDVRQYGAVGDGLTDDTVAFAAIADAVNRAARGQQVTVFFPPGRYRYSGGLVFTAPVRLVGPGATLDYRGDGAAVKLSPPARTSIECAVDGISFAGGASLFIHADGGDEPAPPNPGHP